MFKKASTLVIADDVIRFNPSFSDGLNDEQVDTRITQGLTNEIVKKFGKSYVKIVFDNFFTLFNLIYVVIFFLQLSAARLDENYPITNFTFLIIVTINLLIGTIQEIKAKKTISKLQLISAPSVEVIRNGVLKEIDVKDVVLDDIIYLSSGKEIIADSILVNGDIEVNESQLTGESVPIRKQVGDTLFSGSFVVSGTCYCKVERVGKDNAIEKLSSEAKVYKKPNSQILNSLNKLIKFVTIILLISGVLMILQQYNFEGFKESNEGSFGYWLYHNFYEGFLQKVDFFKGDNKERWSATIQSTCAALLGMIPAGLLMMTSGALVLGVIRLSKHQTLVQDIYCVEMLAHVNVLCLDKTGTITDGSMNVVKVLDLQKNKYDINKIISNMNANLKETNSTAKALENYFGIDSSTPAVDIIPFSSDRKYSAVKFNDETYILGAPEFVLKGGFEKYETYINNEANQGYRVICLAVTNQDLTKSKITKNPKPICFIIIEDQIRPEASDTIRYFRESGVEVKVISGDNPVTVSNVAKRVGVANAENFISLDGLSDDEVRSAALNYTVFGRVKPNQKQIIVKALKDHKKTVAMTGDGVNDILALKEANCSIAMASGSDAVKSVAQLVLLDSNFASMPKVVNEGRRAINNVQQISMLFLVKTFFILTLALLTVFGFFKAVSGFSSFPIANPTQLLMLEMFVIGIPSVYLTIQPNTKRVSGKFLWNVLQKSLPGSVAIVVAVVVTYLVATRCGFDIATIRTIVVICTTFIGLMILYLACKPYDYKKTILFVLMSLICIFICGQSMFKAPHIKIGNYDVSNKIENSFELKNILDNHILQSNEDTSGLLNNVDAVITTYIIMYEERLELQNIDTTILISNDDKYLYDQALYLSKKLDDSYNYHLDEVIDILNRLKESTLFDTTLYTVDKIDEYVDSLKDLKKDSKINLTPMLLTFSLVAISFIIMSICSYVITFINHLSLKAELMRTKKEALEQKNELVNTIDNYYDEDE